MKYCIAWCLIVLFPAVAWAAKPVDWGGELEPAQQAQSAGDYKTAYDRYLAIADHNPLAQFVLGLFEKDAWGGREPNPVAACTWFEKAAQKHIPTAEHFWGDCQAQGIGRTADIPAAIAWYEKAASHGHLISWCTAADYYIQGKAVAKDVAKGITLCAQAAQAHSPPAMLKLAEYYQSGQDFTQNLAAARYWYQQAAEHHAVEGQYHFGLMLAQGEGGNPDLSAALFWLESAASEGYGSAYLPVAVLYANAPVQKDTGALAPEHLAKIYLWNSAAKSFATEPAQQKEIKRIETMVLSVMPPTWRADLDKKVTEHLAKVSANAPGTQQTSQ